MLPSSSFPGSPSPRKKPSTIRLVATGLVTGLLVVAFAGVLVVRGIGNTPRLASGPAATATTLTTTATDVATPDTSTPAPGTTPLPTTSAGNPGTQTGAVRVTQNQDELSCVLDDPTPYTVMLFNGGNVTANWHVYVPAVYGTVSGGPVVLSQPLAGPLSSYPYWADANPQDGSVAPGQTASFVMTAHYGMPCGSTLYKAAVQLHFPSGTSQADIPLTFGGTGPARYSNVVLVSGSLNMTEACPASGVAPAPYTFAIKNTGNYFAVPYAVVPETGLGGRYWTDTQYVEDPQEPVSTWLYPGETWTFTISPTAGLNCGGASYSFELQINNAQGTSTSMTFTDTFN